MKRLFQYPFRGIKTFSSSLFAFYSGLLLIIMIFVTLFYTGQYGKAYSDMTAKYNASVIRRLTSEINSNLQQVEDFSSYPYVYREWSGHMKSTEHYPLGNLRMVNMINLKDFDGSLLQISNSGIDYLGIYLFCNNEQLLYSATNLPEQYILDFYQNQNYKNSEWYKTVLDSDGSAVFLRGNEVNPERRDSFYIARLIKDTASRKELGIYLMEMNTDNFNRFCCPYISSEQESIVIFEGSGEAIYSTGEELTLPANFSLPSGYNETIFSLGETKYLITSDTTDAFNLTIARMVPLSVSEQSRRVAILSIIVFIAFCTLFAFLGFFVLSKQLSKPIEQLKYGMSEVENGNYSVHLSTKRKNELSELFSSYNSMSSKIRTLIEKVTSEEIQKKEAQIIALQRQINPHFLYNTLDSIQIVAISNRDYKVSRMITALAKLLRYAISKEESVTLKDEIEYLDAYVSLQQIRYNDSFSLVLDIEDELLGEPLIRLSLQPIIENSIHHGLEGKPDGIIEVSAYYTESGYEIVIKDNGRGIDSGKLNAINQRLENWSLESTTIGIYNVNSRLKAIFGENSGLAIESIENEGTKVTVRVESRGNK